MSPLPGFNNVDEINEYAAELDEADMKIVQTKTLFSVHSFTFTEGFLHYKVDVPGKAAKSVVDLLETFQYKLSVVHMSVCPEPPAPAKVRTSSGPSTPRTKKPPAPYDPSSKALRRDLDKLYWAGELTWPIFYVPGTDAEGGLIKEHERVRILEDNKRRATNAKIGHDRRKQKGVRKVCKCEVAGQVCGAVFFDDSISEDKNYCEACTYGMHEDMIRRAAAEKGIEIVEDES